MKRFRFILFFCLVCFPALGAEPIPGDSLYQVDGAWIDQSGKNVKLDELRGHAVLMSMIYTSCKYACPMIVEDMKHILAKVPEAKASKIRLVLVSMDPERDTPEALARFSALRKLEPSKSWLLLTTRSKTLPRTLAAALGFSFKKMGSEFTHSNLIWVLDKNGVIRFSRPTLGQGIDEAAKQLTVLTD